MDAATFPSASLCRPEGCHIRMVSSRKSRLGEPDGGVWLRLCCKREAGPARDPAGWQGGRHPAVGTATVAGILAADLLQMQPSGATADQSQVAGGRSAQG